MNSLSSHPRPASRFAWRLGPGPGGRSGGRGSGGRKAGRPTCLDAASEVLQLVDGSLVFRHPLLRFVAWERATAAERREAHAALSAVVPDGPARTWHRVETAAGYDDVLAQDLAAVADLDRSRRGYAAASAAMHRAARLTSDHQQAARWLALRPRTPIWPETASGPDAWRPTYSTWRSSRRHERRCCSHSGCSNSTPAPSYGLESCSTRPRRSPRGRRCSVASSNWATALLRVR